MSGATYEELLHFGRTPTERKIWFEELGGPEADRRMMIEAARKRQQESLDQQEKARQAQ
jgi:hypothetical protein